MDEDVESHCYKHCTYDGLNKTTINDLLICALSFKSIATCATRTCIFSTV